MSNLPPPASSLGQTILRKADGGLIYARNALHAFGMQHPFSFAIGAFAAGVVVCAFLGLHF